MTPAPERRASDHVLEQIVGATGAASVRLVRARDGRVFAASGPSDPDGSGETTCIAVGRVVWDDIDLLFEQLDGATCSSAEIVAAIAPLVPSLLASLQCEAALDAARRRAAHAEAALETTAMGVVVLDPAGTIVFTNKAADALLDRPTGLSRDGGTLRTGALRDSVALRTATERRRPGTAATFVVEGSPPAASLSVVALDGAAEPDGQSTVLWLIDAGAGVDAHLYAFAARYSLSASETKAAHNIVCGMTVDACAKAQGIKVSTVRSHLNSIFLKSGASTQVDLVRSILLTDARVDANDLDMIR